MADKKIDLKCMAEAAVLSAASVCLNIILIGSGLGSFGYIDFIIPIITVLIMMKCNNLRYSILSSAVTLIITIFTIGNVVTGLYIFQSMLTGFIVGIVLNMKKNSYVDDIIISAFFSCILMIIFDINFSNILGVSILKQSSELLEMFPLQGEIRNVFYYYAIISVPLGTTIVTYIASIFLGRKINILNSAVKAKIQEFLNYKKTMSYILCSPIYFNISAVLIFIFEVLGIISTEIENIFYLNIFINSLKYILLFCLFIDSIRFISIFLRQRYNKLMYIVFEFCALYSAFEKFTMTVYILILLSILIDSKFHIRLSSKNSIKYILQCKN